MSWSQEHANSNTDNETKTNSNDGHVKRWLSKVEWNKMSLEQQREHINKGRRPINYNTSNNSEMHQVVQQKSLPAQYNTTNLVITDKESKLYNFMTTPETLIPE